VGPGALPQVGARRLAKKIHLGVMQFTRDLSRRA
jgi:hypothetical protein